jgi:MFS superfamily sulfate permease-like transporter
VVFDPQVQHELDFTTVEVLTELLDWLEARGIEVYVVATHSDLVAMAEHAGIIDVGGRVHLAPTLHEVLAQLENGQSAEPTTPHA